MNTKKLLLAASMAGLVWLAVKKPVQAKGKQQFDGSFIDTSGDWAGV